jgi:SDR family mycofactocin-dependent oxidoreductase
MSDARPLTGQVAVITGGARGQGRAHAVALAALGAAVVLCDVPDAITSVPYDLASAEDLDETVGLVEKAGGVALAVRADVRRRAEVDGVIEQALARFGRIDILLANAGIAVLSRLADLSDEAWHETVDTNLTGVFHSVRAVLPTMRERHYGRIVVTSSIGGRTGVPNMAHYAATKWGVIGLAKSVALEVAGDGITVNVVCPTSVRTPMLVNDSMYRLFAPDVAEVTDEIAKKRFSGQHPIGQPWIEPEDVSREVVHLVTEPGNITGAVIEIGLGMSARMH